MLEWVVHVVRHLFTSFLLGLIFFSALFRIYVLYFVKHPRQALSDFKAFLLNNFEGHAVLPSFAHYVRKYGYDVEEFEVVTEDGFILQIQHILPGQATKSNAQNGLQQSNTSQHPPVILCHGLMQCSEAFVSNEEESLAFYLVDHGFDVWLANNRGSSKLQHVKLSPWSDEFWDWSFDELAKYDFPAFVDFVSKRTNHNKVCWIGHSQGNAQAFGALALYPELQERVQVLVALAPAACVRPQVNVFIKYIFSMSVTNFYKLFGRKAFLPVQMVMRWTFPYKVFGAACYPMFSYLFQWNDLHWVKGRKAKYFQCTRWASCKTVEHWGQMLRVGQLTKYQKMEDTSKEVPPSTKPELIDLSAIRKTPVCLVYGEKDFIIDAEELCKKLHPSVIHHVEKVVEYEHVDAIWAHDAHVRLFPVIAGMLTLQKVESATKLEEEDGLVQDTLCGVGHKEADQKKKK